MIISGLPVIYKAAVLILLLVIIIIYVKNIRRELM